MTAHPRLIVNADDYGLTPGVSAGVREAHQRGIVTTTTAMMVFDNTAADLRLAQEACPKLGLGVHLTASEYRPVRPVDTISSLVGADGLFHSPAELFGPQREELLARFDKEELRDEWRAQIEHFLALGLTIDHFDSHHHVAYFTEATFSVLLDLAREYQVPIRSPVPPAYLQAEDERIEDWHTSWLVKSDVPHPEGILAHFYDETATTADLLSIVNGLPTGTFELMCHPGLVDSDLLAITTYNAKRADELAALTSDDVRAAIASRGIELVTFASLRS